MLLGILNGDFYETTSGFSVQPKFNANQVTLYMRSLTLFRAGVFECSQIPGQLPNCLGKQRH